MSLRGAVKKVIPVGIFRRIEPYGHLAEAFLMQVIYGFPGRGLKIIGVTGTNGKTTTSFMIYRMLYEAGYSVSLMTTVGWGAGANITPQVEHMTTMPTRQLLKRIKQIKSQGVEWLVLEVTSHALGQNRVWGIPFDIAVMTNVTHEHLDYHGSFERYLEAKRKLFEITDSNRQGHRAGVVNAEDPSAKLFLEDITVPITYGVNKGFLQAKNVKMSPSGTTYTAEAGEKERYDINCRLPGSFNVYNSLAAIGVAKVLELSKEEIEQGIAALKSVEGRMERLDEGQDFEVIVDYAHTPDSFEKLFSDLKTTVKGKMIAMFGSAGRRDTAKRALLGQIAGKYCDELIVTEEDDRDVDGIEIMEQIAEGAKNAGKTLDRNLFLIHDRAKAIEFTIARAKAGDMVLLLGKGHEKNIERAHGLDDWDEMATARNSIKENNTS